MGGFSRAFDLIAKEYGLSDEEILQKPVCRVRQMVAGIEERVMAERRYQASLVEWETKTLASVIASTVPTQKKGQKNPLADMVSAIKLEFAHGGSSSPEVDSSDDPAVFVEQGSQRVANRVGSFEKLSTGLGR